MQKHALKKSVKMNSPSDGSRVTHTYVLTCMEMTCGQSGDKSSSFLKLPYFLLSHLLFFPFLCVYLLYFLLLFCFIFRVGVFFPFVGFVRGVEGIMGVMY